MKQVIVGTYHLGHPCKPQVVLREGTGGEYWLHPGDQENPRIKIGADEEAWPSVVTALLHEAFELAADLERCRFCPYLDQADDMAGFWFFFDHHQFAEICSSVAELMTACLPDLSRAWKEWRETAETEGELEHPIVEVH